LLKMLPGKPTTLKEGETRILEKQNHLMTNFTDTGKNLSHLLSILLFKDSTERDRGT
jgi:hypothetical protein